MRRHSYDISTSVSGTSIILTCFARNRVTRAAVYIHDAIHERPIKTHRSVGLPMQDYTCLHNYWYRFTISSLSFVHLMLAFLEPALNYEDPDKVAFSNSFGKYGNDVVEKVLWIETVIVAVYALDVGMNLCWSAGLLWVEKGGQPAEHKVEGHHGQPS